MRGLNGDIQCTEHVASCRSDPRMGEKGVRHELQPCGGKCRRGRLARLAPRRRLRRREGARRGHARTAGYEQRRVAAVAHHRHELLLGEAGANRRRRARRRGMV